MRKFESAEWENVTQLNLAEAQVFTGDEGNLQSMEKIYLKFFEKDDLISRMALFNQVIIKHFVSVLKGMRNHL